LPGLRHYSCMARHVSDEKIESLALGRLRTSDSIRLQRHLYKCGLCLRRLVEITLDLALKGLAPEQLSIPDSRKPLYIVHDTADGFIYSETERRGHKWLARHWGEQLQGARECTTMREANEFLVTAFQEMFPEHRCTERCRVGRSEENSEER
jgi:hypothetical protein